MNQNRKILFIFSFIVTITIFGFFNLKKVEAADCGGDVPCACGDTVIASTTLTADLDCSGTGQHGLIIGSNDVIIDGDNHSITGGGSYNGIDNSSNYDNIIIKNFSNISNFNNGIYFSNSASSTITNNTINLNNNGINLSYLASSTISSNNTASNTNYGINLVHSDANFITSNISSSNDYGLILDNSRSNILTNNTLNSNNVNIYIYGIIGLGTINELAYDNNIDNTNLVDNKPIYYLYNESDQIYDGDIIGDIGMFWCINCTNIIIKNATLSENNYAGIYLRNTTSSTVENIVANSNDSYGIYLANSPNDLLIDNTTNLNDRGIYLSSSASSTLTNNIANSNKHGIYFLNSASSTLNYNVINSNTYSGIYLNASVQNILMNNTTNSNIYGIYLSNSASSTLTNNISNLNADGIYISSSASSTITNNTVNLNTGYGIYLMNSNNSTIINNSINNNLNSLYDDQENTYSNNYFFHNLNNKTLTFTDIIRKLNLNVPTDFNVSMFNTDDSECIDCTYSISISPTELITTNVIGNVATTTFTPTKSGIYSLIYTIEDSNNNITKRVVPFFINANATSTTKYYLRETLPTHGQSIGNGHDSASMLLAPPSDLELWNCGAWVQNAPDEIPDYSLASISDINIYTWYKMITDGYVGIERFGTYGEVVDFSSDVSTAPDYTWVNKNFTDLNWSMDYQRAWYLLSVKVAGGSVEQRTIVAQPSYVDITHQYTTTPAIKSISNENIIVLSATAPADATSSASIVLDNPNTEATSTTLVLTDFTRPFLNATSTIDSNSTTTIVTTIGASTSSTLDAVALDLVPSAGSVEINIDTWNTSGTYYKKWTETGSSHDISTQHSIGSLKATTPYIVEVDDVTLGTYTSNALGEITFTYDGGYSTKTFEVTETTDATLPTSQVTINSGSTHTSSTTVALNFSASDDLSSTSSMKMNISNYLSFATSTGWIDYANSTSSWSILGTSGTNTVYFKVRDEALNESATSSDTIIFDNTLPTITILGSNPTSVYRGDAYTDSGATANDDIDGDISANIQTTSNVNTNTVGSYTVTYTVSDSALNTATSTRVVNVTNRPGGGGGGGSGSLPPSENNTTSTPITIIDWTSGTWVKTSDSRAVYFVDSNNARHAYPNQNIWRSYFGDDFSFVTTISKEQMASYQLDRSVPYNVNSLFKISSVPKVYRVGYNRSISWIHSEELARTLYGNSWNKLVQDLSDAFFGDYAITDDSDNDGLNDTDEDIYKTDKNNVDTDNDSYLDGEEVIHGYDPTKTGNIKL